MESTDKLVRKRYRVVVDFQPGVAEGVSKPNVTADPRRFFWDRVRQLRKTGKPIIPAQDLTDDQLEKRALRELAEKLKTRLISAEYDVYTVTLVWSPPHPFQYSSFGTIVEVVGPAREFLGDFIAERLARSFEDVFELPPSSLAEKKNEEVAVTNGGHSGSETKAEAEAKPAAWRRLLASFNQRIVTGAMFLVCVLVAAVLVILVEAALDEKKELVLEGNALRAERAKIIELQNDFIGHQAALLQMFVQRDDGREAWAAAFANLSKTPCDKPASIVGTTRATPTCCEKMVDAAAAFSIAANAASSVYLKQSQVAAQPQSSANHSASVP
jgi:hypothetical protein